MKRFLLTMIVLPFNTFSMMIGLCRLSGEMAQGTDSTKIHLDEAGFRWDWCTGANLDTFNLCFFEGGFTMRMRWQLRSWARESGSVLKLFGGVTSSYLNLDLLNVLVTYCVTFPSDCTLDLDLLDVLLHLGLFRGFAVDAAKLETIIKEKLQ